MTDKRLYEVTWSGRCFVLAGSGNEAAKEAMRALVAPTDAGLEAQAQPAVEVPPEWAVAIPFGDDGKGDRTCAAILAEQEVRRG